VLTITGTGFSVNMTVTVDNSLCKLISANFTTLECQAPPNPTSTDKLVDLVVSQGASTSATLPASYNYDFSRTPVISLIQPSVLSVTGRQLITCTGTSLPTLSLGVELNGRQVSIISSNATHLILRSPPMQPGFYDLSVHIPGIGLARVPSQIEYRLYVASFLPRIGSISGGTLITVSGDGFDAATCLNNQVVFGLTQRCQVIDCASTWLRCRTSSAHVQHVVTNMGVDPYLGKGYAWSQPQLKISLGDSVKWTWTPPVGITSVSYRVVQTEDAIGKEAVGFASGPGSPTGSFTFQFNQPGVFYYWSDVVDATGLVSFRGSVEVTTSVDKALELAVFRDGVRAQARPEATPSNEG